MKPVAFDYCRPETLDEATDVLQEHGSEASILAGGLSLGPMLNMRLVRPIVVVDINRMVGLGEFVNGGDTVSTGALMRQADALRDEELRRSVPLLAQALPHLGHYQTRSRGTFGGSIAHGDPSAEIPLCLVALDGEVELASRRGGRRMKARDFFLGVLTTARASDEMVTALHWPKARRRTGHAFDEIAQRRGDFALAAAACEAALDDGDKIARLELGLGGIEDRPVAIDLSEFHGETASAELGAAIADRVRSEVVPISDMAADAEYRSELAGILAERVAMRAFAVAQGSEGGA